MRRRFGTDCHEVGLVMLYYWNALYWNYLAVYVHAELVYTIQNIYSAMQILCTATQDTKPCMLACIYHTMTSSNFPIIAHYNTTLHTAPERTTVYTIPHHTTLERTTVHHTIIIMDITSYNQGWILHGLVGGGGILLYREKVRTSHPPPPPPSKSIPDYNTRTIHFTSP